MLLNDGLAFAEVFKERNCCVTLADFLSPILVFMAQVVFTPEVFSPVRPCFIKTGEVFRGALIGKPVLPHDQRSQGFKLGIRCE